MLLVAGGTMFFTEMYQEYGNYIILGYFGGLLLMVLATMTNPNESDEKETGGSQ